MPHNHYSTFCCREFDLIYLFIFCDCLFHLSFPQDSSTLYHAIGFSSFLRPNNIPLYWSGPEDTTMAQKITFIWRHRRTGCFNSLVFLKTVSQKKSIITNLHGSFSTREDWFITRKNSTSNLTKHCYKIFMSPICSPKDSFNFPKGHFFPLVPFSNSFSLLRCHRSFKF